MCMHAISEMAEACAKTNIDIFKYILKT